jgi:hypothetical protein
VIFVFIIVYCVIHNNRQLSPGRARNARDPRIFRRVEIGLLTVIAIRGRPVKGHSLAIVR